MIISWQLQRSWSWSISFLINILPLLWGHSMTMWTQFCPFLTTTYLQVDIVKLDRGKKLAFFGPPTTASSCPRSQWTSPYIRHLQFCVKHHDLICYYEIDIIFLFRILFSTQNLIFFWLKKGLRFSAYVKMWLLLH